MYGGWTEIAVLFRNILGFIWDIFDVFTVHISSLRVQIQFLKSSLIVYFGGMILRIVFFSIIHDDDHEKCNKKSDSKLICCLGKDWENKN